MIGEKQLTSEEKSILFAMCLGDGYVSKPRTTNSNSSFECTHSIKQLPYLTWKRDLIYKILEGIAPPKISFKTIHLKSNNKEYQACRFCKVHSYFTYLRKLLYNNNVKELSEKSLNMLTVLGLAIWFMDDGYGIRIRNRKGLFSNRIEIGMATDSFTKEENEIIIKTIYNKFGVKFRLGRKRSPNGYNQLWFIRTSSKELVNKFINLVRPYIIEEMLYKIAPKVTEIQECSAPENQVKILSELT